MKDYNSNLQAWNTENIPNKFSAMSFGFKIEPVVDALRSRDMFMFDYSVYANVEDVNVAGMKDFFNYKQSFFVFNNTVRNFPNFAFDDNTPEFNESEYFCIHIWYK